jgi:hypothetical protein
MLEAFQKVADVDEYWDDSWQGGERFDPRKYDKPEPDLVVLFQTEPSPELFRYWRCPIVAIPMLDSPYSWTTDLCLRTTKSTVIAFGREQAEMYRKKGIRVMPLKYACNLPVSKIPHSGGLRGFFWERGPVRWEHVKKLIGNTQFDAILIKQAPDPGFTSSIISKDDVEKYQLQFVEPWGTKEDYWNLLATCDVYFAPRPTEGIGMGFLEAMTMGLVVVAPDGPTMNEYIEHGKNGILYDLSNPQLATFSFRNEQRARDASHWNEICKTFEYDLEKIVSKTLKQEPSKRPVCRLTLSIINIMRVFRLLIQKKRLQFP